jgi:transposase
MKKNGGLTMGKLRRRGFTKEFKLEALRRILEDKEGYSRVVRDLGVNRSMLYKWKESLENDGVLAFPGKGK